MAIEIEGDGSIEIGTVDMGSRVRQSAENFGTGKPKELPDPTELIANWGLADATSSGVVAFELPWCPTFSRFAVR